MNVRKVALFVEGYAEQIFVRDFLVKWYDWDVNKVGLDCYVLHSDSLSSAPFPWGSKESECYFQILNVGNDKKVLSKMLQDADRLYNLGYSLVLGLRDMFSNDYHKATFDKNNQRIIDPEINERFIKGVQSTIEANSKEITMQLHFAIMEVEAWLLGMPKFIKQLSDIKDPETDVYHPAAKLKELIGAMGSSYDKHQGEIESLMDQVTKDDYLALLQSGRCASFKSFVETLTGVSVN